MSKIHYITHNIIIGQAELFYVHRLNGWIIPGGAVIQDQIEAIKYACFLNDLITTNTNLKNQKLKQGN